MGSLIELANAPLPEGLASAEGAVWAGWADGLRPDPELTVSQWADQHRRLSSVSSAEPGAWRTSRTPYLAEIMDCCTPSHPMTDGVVMAGTQLGKSESLYNLVGYVIDQAPGPMMLVMPTTDTGKKVSKQRLQPMIDETPALRGKVRDPRSRDSGNTTLLKEFPGGLLAIVGANSGPALRSMPVRYLLLDEIDAYPHDVDGEGDPEDVAEKRTDTFGARAKRVRVSSPKRKGSSRIERRWQEGTQGRYHVPCPHCGHEQYLRWQQMRWETVIERECTCTACGAINAIPVDAGESISCADCQAVIVLDVVREHATDEVTRTWYECEACAVEIGEQHKTAMLEAGRWIHDHPGPGDVLAVEDPHPWAIWARLRGGEIVRFLPRFTRALSWHLPSLYSPLGWFSWVKAVRLYLRAKQGGMDEATGEPLLQVFENTVLAQAYEAAGSRPKDEALKLRAEPYQLGQVPRECLLLIASVDVQANRLEAICLGFGRDGQVWVIDHQRFYGEPVDLGDAGPWAKLTEWRRQAWPHAGGGTLRIATCAVDSGYLAHTVYYYASMHRAQQVFATKGQSQMGKPLLGRPTVVDINWRGKVIKRGAEVWPIGTDTAKEQLYTALERTEGYGVIHFPARLPDEFFEQLTAEQLHRRRIKGREVHEWHLASGKRNEILDLFVMGFAAAERAGVRRVNWDRLEQVINPDQRDLFALPAPSLQPSEADGEVALTAEPSANAAEHPDRETAPEPPLPQRPVVFPPRRPITVPRRGPSRPGTW